jgi:hypothetical protein
MVFEIQDDATFKEVAGEGPGLVRLYNRVLNVPVPEVVLQGPRVVAVVGELEPTGMTKHVRVDREWHLGGLADAVDESVTEYVGRGSLMSARHTSRSAA